ncbi:DEAD/DEAH box helicase [Thiocystis violacea]|uniref:DEAD/DEAH box helicase n=1 Tax=Thiocystis violacea TaxID=13725 RepID=UPI001902E92E
MSVFSRFAPRLQQAIVAQLGWTSLRAVQEDAGEALLAGDNAIILAATAGGKTEAAIFPMLSRFIEDPPDGVGALYIAPIKALLNNQSERLGRYTEMVGLRRFVWHGDISDAQRRGFRKAPAELLLTTPESLEVMLVSPRVDAARLFTDLRLVVIDEVHALAGSERGAHLMSVIERLARLSRHDPQRVGLSATVGNPDAILEWLRGSSRRAGRVVDPARAPGRRQLLVAHRPDLLALARSAAHLAKGQKSLFFCQSRATTETVAETMRHAGTAVFVHHSAVSREERDLAEERFQRGSDACIVCTSTLELGLDVGDLDRVLQAEAPETVSSFLQRMGRTGRRAGQAANTTFFCTSTESLLQAIALIELAKSGWVESVAINPRCWPVLIHQLLALALATDGVTVEMAWDQLSRVPDFRDIRRGEFERLLDWMRHDQSLRLTAGRLVLGPKAERLFGRRHFMELYAVFASPRSYQVETIAGEPLGTLNQTFVDRLVEEVSCFLLGGRAWVAFRLDHAARRVLVEPAPRGRQPSWGGFLPQFLGREICARIRRILAEEETFGYLDPSAVEILVEQREAMRGVLASGTDAIEVSDGELRWWTFAGGRINATLRYAIEVVAAEWTVIPSNFLIKIRGDDLNLQGFRSRIERLGDTAFWHDEGLWTDVAASLPNYRLSKFQPLMPPWVEQEVLAHSLLDVDGVRQWLTGSNAGAMRNWFSLQCGLAEAGLVPPLRAEPASEVGRGWPE